MLQLIEQEKTPYEKYFMTEAPARRPYMKIVTANPDNRLKSFDDNIEDLEADDEIPDEADMELVDDDELDFDDNIEDLGDDLPTEDELMDDDEEGDDIPMEDDAPEAPETLDVDHPEDNIEPEEVTDDPVPEAEPAPEETADEEPDLQTDPPEGTEGTEPEDPDAGIDTPEGEAPAEGGEGGDLDTEDPTAGGEDFEDNIEDTGDEGGEDAGTDDAGGGEENQQGVRNTTENQLKYTLFRNMKSLYLAIKNYEESLDSLNTPSMNYNSAIKVANNKLADLEEMMYEFMTLRFRDETYISCMEFYQKCLVTIQFIFELLRNNKENLNPNDKTIN